MRKIYILSIALSLVVGLVSVETANAVDLKGALNTQTLAEGTYNLTGNVLVNKGQVLTVSPGVKIIAQGNYLVEVAGDLICNGTDAKPIYFTYKDEKKGLDSLGVSGWWGGILVDSTAKNINITFTHINYTGGMDAGGSAQASFDVEGMQSYNNGCKVIFEDNWMFGGIDDAIHLAGYITCSIKRNVLQRLGGPDGDLINIKAGAQGDICYNYIWSSANSGIKLNTSKTVFAPQTKWNIYNNTIINGNWRKVGELSSAILIDQFAAANIYNNVIVGCRNGINITSKADYTKTYYGNNLIYSYAAAPFANVDSSTNTPYILGSKGTAQNTDKIASGLAACASVFTNWSSDITVDSVDLNVPTLKTGSPAIGAGTTTVSTLYSAFSGGARVGTVMALNIDMGAYPTDKTGNKHLPSKNPKYASPAAIVSTGVNEFARKSLSVYPNPVIDELTLTSESSSDNMIVEIINIQGKVVLTKTFGAINQLTISVSNLSTGFYICRLIQGSTVATSKFLKK